MNPIVCIGNYHTDKKTKELMKACHCIELPAPTHAQIDALTQTYMPSIMVSLSSLAQQDLRKWCMLYRLYQSGFSEWSLLLSKTDNDDTRRLTRDLLSHRYSFHQHVDTINETDRAIVGLLWHENVADILSQESLPVLLSSYPRMLDNMCMGDALDRDIFQKQIGQFSEMSSLIKTFHNNHLLHSTNMLTKNIPTDIRFTKVLTKYSTEYNNRQFILHMCQQLQMNKQDMFARILHLKQCDLSVAEICAALNKEDITKLDVQRLLKYMDRYIKANVASAQDEDMEEELPVEEGACV